MFGPFHLVVLDVAQEHEALLPLGLGHGEHLPAAEVPPHGANVEAVLLCDGSHVHKLKPELSMLIDRFSAYPISTLELV